MGGGFIEGFAFGEEAFQVAGGCEQRAVASVLEAGRQGLQASFEIDAEGFLLQERRRR